jgi:Uma2 family endonuclease
MATAEVDLAVEPRVHQWTREEYDRMAEAGLFDGKRVELIDGEVIDRYEDPDPRLHRWTEEEYDRLAEIGLFDGKRVELIAGRVIEMSAMNRPHVRAVKRAVRVFEAAFGEGWFVQSQAPLNLDELDETSKPEPDVAVIAGDEDDYVDEHPDTAALILEVSDSTYRYDSSKKASLYARARIPDYWILNLKERQLEVRRRPVPDAAVPFWFSYAEEEVFKAGEYVSPLARPDVKIAVADLLPWPRRDKK